jgi:hypothetical protein
MAKYTLFIDESGDAGIGQTRSKENGGASPYMTLGAVLIENSLLEDLRQAINNLHITFNKPELHCKNLRHFQKLHFAKLFAKMPLVSFGTISLKETLGWYKDKIDADSKLYYNKCAQLLLECVGEHLALAKIKPNELDIIFEEGNFAYEKLRNLIKTCQRSPIRERVKLLKNIDANKITAKKKSEEPLLQLSDLVAHSLYKCVDKSNGCYHITEPRYLIEISNTFYHDINTGQIIGKGIQPVYNLSNLKLDNDIHSVLVNIKNIKEIVTAA